MIRARAACLGLALGIAGHASSAEPVRSAALPPSPFRIVHATRRSPPYVDATPVCLPRDRAGASEIAARLNDGDVVGARRKLAELEDAQSGKGASGGLALLRAILDARIAGGSQRSAGRSLLRRLAESEADAPSRGCALLESARLSMLLERPLDARVDRVRGRRQFADGHWPPEQAPSANWLEAEELHRSGDEARARALWTEIEASAGGRLALAARLRLIEASHPVVDSGTPSDGAAEAWAEFPTLLERASALRLDVEPWSLVAGELAIRAGDLQAAHYWLARAELAWPGGLASIRKADVLAGLERTADARNTLERVSRAARDPAVREMAELRIAGLELLAGERESALARIAGPARSLHPEVRAEALSLRAASQLASGRAPAALDSYARLARAGGRTDEDAGFRSGLAHAARELSAGRASCPLILQKLGSRTALLARYLSEPEPLLRVGDCFLTLNMPGAALDTYRALQARFGADSALALPLRIATAALADGDLEAARAAVDAALASETAGDPLPSELRWRWLRFTLAEREGRALNGFGDLDLLARAKELPQELRPEVELAIVRWMEAGGDAAAARAALQASLVLEPELANDARGFAWLRLADMAMGASDSVAAAEAYERAAVMLAPGPLRDRASHHAALLAETRQARREALTTAAAAPTSEWVRVAGLELRLQKLAEEVDAELARLP